MMRVWLEKHHVTLAIGLALTVGCITYVSWLPFAPYWLWSEVAAAWVQAIGGLAAICVVVAVSRKEAADRSVEAIRMRAETRQSVALILCQSLLGLKALIDAARRDLRQAAVGNPPLMVLSADRALDVRDALTRSADLIERLIVTPGVVQSGSFVACATLAALCRQAIFHFSGGEEVKRLYGLEHSKAQSIALDTLIESLGEAISEMSDGGGERIIRVITRDGALGALFTPRATG